MGASKPGRGRQPRFQAPDLPREQWCRARQLYESGLSLKQIGALLDRDPRTVKASILRNSDVLDKRRTPRVLAPYLKAVHELLTVDEIGKLGSIRAISQRICAILQDEMGYSGSEIALRKYLTDLPTEERLLYGLTGSVKQE